MSEIRYFDNAATTAVDKRVLDKMLPFFTENYGNPSSIYSLARTNKKAIDEARKNIANVVDALPSEIFFTSCGSEADNWAIKGAADALKHKGNHIITTAIEHHAVLHTCEYLAKNGFEITYLPVDEVGRIKIADLKAAIKDTTILITIMYANNEIGTTQPIEEIGEIAKAKGILFHTDAVQAAGHMPINVNALNIDMLSMSAHKMYGPKGIGALYIRKGVKITPLIHGGSQENGKRAGTENVAFIVGFGEAAKICRSEMETDEAKIKKLADKLRDGILSKVSHCAVNGDLENRLPGNVNISFKFIEGEGILIHLDMLGAAASSGSACTSGSLDPSHVLLALGLAHEEAHGSLRLSLGRFNTEEDIEFLLNEIPPIIDKLRQMSPLYEEYLNK